LAAPPAHEHADQPDQPDQPDGGSSAPVRVSTLPGMGPVPGDPAARRQGTRPHCARGGGLLAPGAAWCGQCLAPAPGGTGDAVPITHEAGPGGVPTALGAAPGGAPAGPMGWRPDLRPGPAPSLTWYSRWRAGPTTHGPVGRISWTAALLIPYWIFWDNPFGWIFLAMWTGLVLPVALRDLWSRTPLVLPDRTKPDRTKPDRTKPVRSRPVRSRPGRDTRG
jgi:hypothetical protein